MAARENASLPEDSAARQRLRAETPPPQYWRRWAQDAQHDDATEQAGGEPPSARTPAPGPTTSGPPGQEAAAESPYRILIVEDDRTQALFAQSVLHGAGMKAEVQMQPEGVIEAIGRFDPDLILMDLHMPGLDGMRLTTLIRQQQGFQLLPIVFLTGDPDPERQFEVLESGADDFLTKPIRPRHLIAAVSNRIQRTRAQLRQPSASTSTMLRSHPETDRQQPAAGCCSRSTRPWLIAPAAACSSSRSPARWDCASATAMRPSNGS